MNRQVYLLGVALALLTGAFLLTNALLYPPGVTEANFRRLRQGMTVGQVNALFGCPGNLGLDNSDPCLWHWQSEEDAAVQIQFELEEGWRAGAIETYLRVKAATLSYRSGVTVFFVDGKFWKGRHRLVPLTPHFPQPPLL